MFTFEQVKVGEEVCFHMIYVKDIVETIEGIMLDKCSHRSKKFGTYLAKICSEFTELFCNYWPNIHSAEVFGHFGRIFGIGRYHF